MKHIVLQASLFFLLLCLGVIGSGCATIVGGGSTQEVNFQSQPEGALVSLNGTVIGKTPMAVTLKRQSEQTLAFSKDGYQTQTMQMTTSMNPWFWGNILIGGLLGSTTDGVSGAVHEYVPGKYFVTLPPIGAISVLSVPTLSPPPAGDQAKVKEFIVLEYSNICKDLSKGSGEYLNTMLVLLNIRQEFQSSAVSKMRSNAQIYHDIPSFADSCIEIASQYK
jgi:hypothetical protein